MLLISIPAPCHEKWNEMSPNEKGAFCGVCSKTVVDFTSLSDEDVQNYFLNKRGEKTCGRFRNDQLTDNEDPLKRLLADAAPFWKKFLAIVLVVFGSLLTGCNNNIAGDITTQENAPAGIVKLVTLGNSSAVAEPANKLTGDTTVVETCGEVMGDLSFMPVKIEDDIVGIVAPPVEIMGKVKMMPAIDENGNPKKNEEE